VIKVVEGITVIWRDTED